MTVALYYDPRAMGLEVGEIMGSEATVLCPFHDDHHPSATFNMTSGLFHCFACGEGMSATQLVRALGTNIVRVPVMLTPRVRNREEVEWRNVLNAPIAIDNPYLLSRGVGNDLIHEYGIRDVRYGVAFVNYDPAGRPIGAQIRRYEGEPRYLFVGQRAPVWPMAVLTSHKTTPLFVVEGVFGALRGLSAGVDTVAVMGASAVHSANRLLNGRRTMTVFDADFAGYLGAAKFIYLRGSPALVPGAEADELPVEQWAHLERESRFTTSVYELQERSGDPAKFQRLMTTFTGRVFAKK